MQAVSAGLVFAATPFSNVANVAWAQSLQSSKFRPIIDANGNYDVPPFGNVSLMHFTDVHAQLIPAFYREPNIHLGSSELENTLPHMVGKHLLNHLGLKAGTHDAHALAFLDFETLAHKFGAMGGYAHMATLVKNIRGSRPGSLLLDGGDTWQGSATSLWTKGQDMIDADLMLGVDVMTGHWEFTYGMERIQEVIENDFAGKIDFVAQNVLDLEFEDPVFNPYVIKEINGVPTAIIGQAFPYVPIANPRHLVEDWQFGIQEERLQSMIDEARGKGAQVVVLLSHNGMDIDLKLASRMKGLTAIMGGHTHDAVPVCMEIASPSGKTLVINSGSAGKFLSVLDLDVKDGKVRDYKFALVPVFSNLLKPDPEMQAYIEKVRKPFLGKLNEELAVSKTTLYRRSTFNGTFDQLLLDAMMEVFDAQIAFSPGFRWGMSVLPGQSITMEDLMSQTAMTYPQTFKDNMKGSLIKNILEDVADNRFNPDPYMQQGGDMARLGGLTYTIDPTQKIGKRIQNMQLNGKPIDANKSYSVARWASVGKDIEGPPIWEVVAEYLRSKKEVTIGKLNNPIIKNVSGHKGIEIA